jgi:hypothetical protein
MLRRVKSKAPAVQNICYKRGRLLLARRSEDATPSGACHALLPAGLLRRKRLAMTCREHRHCEGDSLKQSRKYPYSKITTYHNYFIHNSQIKKNG